MSFTRNIMVTGAAGFIGCHVARRLVNNYPQYRVAAYDALTYAGNLDNLADLEDKPNYAFVHGDICDADKVADTFERYAIDTVIHLAAESHVDRSIADPLVFARTNVMGTLTLLNAALNAWKSGEWRVESGQGNKSGEWRGESGEGKSAKACSKKASAPSPLSALHSPLFYHISTDEVFGALEQDLPEGREVAPGHTVYGTEFFDEKRAYRPHSPYSASKASSDHLVRAFHDTYGLPTVISNCSNNYGPYQYPEKLLPLFIDNIVNSRPLPVYGEGVNVRDWLYVEDHARAIDMIMHHGTPGETYCIGGHNEWRNIDLVRLLIDVVDERLGRPRGASLGLITHVTDRLGHDSRYAIDASQIERSLGWRPSVDLREGLVRTVDWYLTHQDWTQKCKM